MDSSPFPIGSIFITADKKNPSTYRPGTYRVPFGKGRAIVCVDDESQVEALKEPEKQLGAASQVLNVIKQTISTGDEGSANVVTDVTPNEGGKITISKYQSSITAYIRKRVENTAEFNPFNIEDAFQPEGTYFPENAIIDPATMGPQDPNPYQP